MKTIISIQKLENYKTFKGFYNFAIKAMSYILANYADMTETDKNKALRQVWCLYNFIEKNCVYSYCFNTSITVFCQIFCNAIKENGFFAISQFDIDKVVNSYKDFCFDFAKMTARDIKAYNQILSIQYSNEKITNLKGNDFTNACILKNFLNYRATDSQDEIGLIVKPYYEEYCICFTDEKNFLGKAHFMTIEEKQKIENYEKRQKEEALKMIKEIEENREENKIAENREENREENKIAENREENREENKIAENREENREENKIAENREEKTFLKHIERIAKHAPSSMLFFKEYTNIIRALKEYKLNTDFDSIKEIINNILDEFDKLISNEEEYNNSEEEYKTFKKILRLINSL